MSGGEEEKELHWGDGGMRESLGTGRGEQPRREGWLGSACGCWYGRA